MFAKIKENIIEIICVIILIAIVLATVNLCRAQSPPVAYYTFDLANPLAPAVGAANVSAPGTYAIGTGGKVGKYLDISNGNNTVTAGAYNIGGSNAFTVQMLFKMTYNSQYGLFQPMFQYAGVDASFEYPNIGYKGNYIEMSGLNRKSWQYYLDNQWHHAAFTYNKVTGIKKIYIDGLLANGFTLSQGAGTTFPNQQQTLYITPFNVLPRMFRGYVDEFAFYNSELTASQIYKNYTEISSGSHYTTSLYTGTIPTAPSTTGPIDADNYPPGYPTTSVTVSQQLLRFPAARFNPYITQKPNLSWFDLGWMCLPNPPNNSPMTQPNRDNVRFAQYTLARDYNMAITASENTTVDAYGITGDTTRWKGLLVNIANDYPQYPAFVKSFWAQVSTGKISSQTLPVNHYARNNSNQFINLQGAPNTTKYRSPAAPNDSIKKDGIQQGKYIDTLLTYLTRPIDYWNENGEVIPRFSDQGITNNTLAIAERNASYPAFTLQDYQAKKFQMADSTYSSYGRALTPSTKYTEYGIDGQNNVRINYRYARVAQSIIENGRYYSTGDFYPRYPNNWLIGYSAWNGWERMVAGRTVELSYGDTFCSPFVAHGWDSPENINIAPPQWLGLLKCMVGLGSEYMYPSTFSFGAVPGKDYVWAATFPAMAQALEARVTWWKQTYLLRGNMPQNFAGQIADPGYDFYSGDRSTLCVIRKHISLPKYIIYTTINPLSNMKGQVVDKKNITLNGFNNIIIETRRQGATYVLDSTVVPPAFYQLDKWHEAKHPYYWSTDFYYEAENADTATAVVKTYNQTGTDFTTYTTVLGTITDTATYSFTPRGAGNWYVYVKARTTGAASGFELYADNVLFATVPCVTSTNLCFYNLDNCINNNKIVTPSLTANALHTLKIYATNASLEIDSIIVSSNASLPIVTCGAPCTITASITPASPVNLCTGGSVTLTSSSAFGYMWSTGATTQTITAAVAATYTVTVSDAGGCTASATCVVNIVAPVTPTITPSGSTTLCAGQSVVLSSSVGTSYLWSTGATTQDITATTQGSYTVTVTTNACTATSIATVVTVNALPTPAIALTPPTPVCVPSTIAMAASGGVSYVWNTGAITSATLASIGGTYTVTATNAAGCTKSISTNAVINTPIPSYVSPPGTTTICTGDSVTFTATAGQGYTWSTGATTQSITVGAWGNYACYVTDINGCDALSNVVTVDTLTGTQTPAAIYPLAQTDCDTIVLAANTGSTYLWSTGATTQSISAIINLVYTVTVTNAAGCTSSASITTNDNLLTPPNNLVNLEIGSTGARIQFNPTVTGTFYRCEISDKDYNKLSVVTLTTNETNLYWIRLKPKTIYYWRVRTYCKYPVQKMSGWSNYKQIITK